MFEHAKRDDCAEGTSCKRHFTDITNGTPELGIGQFGAMKRDLRQVDADHTVAK
nr:hypothetical protein [Candidatus Microthrix sp.]